MTHPHMILELDELERMSSIPDKVCVLMATCQAPMRPFLWSVFSMMLRSDPDVIEHFNFVINGPDARTGDTELQDQKQEFLEALRDIPFHGKPGPITIMRVWSRIGHTQSMEMATPWIHTENYVLMHDDVIVLNNKWSQTYKETFLPNKNLAIMTAPPLLLAKGLVKSRFQGKWKLGLPHINSCFMICRKPLLVKEGCRWWGYHVEHEIDASTWEQFDEFIEYHKNLGHIQEGLEMEDEYHYINMDIGSWSYYQLHQAGYEFDTLPFDAIHHFKAASWDRNPRNLESRLDSQSLEIQSLEEEIRKADENGILPGAWNLYSKHIDGRSDAFPSKFLL